MKAKWLLLAWLFSLCSCAPLYGQRTHAVDGAGRDISVALFSTRSLQAVAITPAAPNAWISRCPSCARKPLPAKLVVKAPVDLFAGGSLRVVDTDSHEERVAAGLWHLRSSGGRDLDVVLTLPSERYVMDVLSAEAAPNEPDASLRALAVVVRTYALRGHHYTAGPGRLSADECDSTECQAMRFTSITDAIVQAARSTAGETLWYGDARAQAFFGENCGGLTEDASALWPRLDHPQYLRSHVDPYCRRTAAAGWHAEIPVNELVAIARQEGWRVPVNIVAARVTERSTSHRALRITLSGANGTTSTITASALRFGIGRALGWNRVRSDAYVLGLRHDSLVFDGHGFGNGVGLCQAGAAEMAREGKTARDILAFYFPGTEVRIRPSDEGWREVETGPLTVRSAEPVTDAQRRTLAAAWSDAELRFPSHRRALHPQIIFAPTTEIFRQMTAQAGWALASTQGDNIVLQPEAILKANGETLSRILRHEMLHVLVEAESAAGSPLWLREGLVEVLAGEAAVLPAMRSDQRIDDDLAHADSLTASRRAHAAAAARVQALVARYGLTAVRGWLSSGALPDVARSESDTRTNSVSRDRR